MKRLECNLKKFYEERNVKNIIVFGVSTEVIEFFNHTYTQDRIVFFIDNCKSKQNTKIQIHESTFNIYSADVLKEEKHRKYVVLIGARAKSYLSLFTDKKIIIAPYSRYIKKEEIIQKVLEQL